MREWEVTRGGDLRVRLPEEQGSVASEGQPDAAAAVTDTEKAEVPASPAERESAPVALGRES